MIAGFALGAALAGDPVACALDGLSDGTVSWTADGEVTLYDPNGRRLQVADTGGKLTGSVSFACKGTTVRFSASPAGGRGSLLRLETYILDFEDVITSWAQYDPVEMVCAHARAAPESGDWLASAAALLALNPSDPRVTRSWLGLGRAAAAASLSASDPKVALTTSDVAVQSLKFATYTDAEVRAIELQHAKALLAAGQAGAAVYEFKAYVEAQPMDKDGRLALSDAQWTALDKAGAAENYLLLVDQYPLDAMPPQIAQRCKACAKAIKQRR